MNIKYLGNKPSQQIGNVSFNLWPRAASSHVFFSSTMDYVMAQVKI